MSTDNTKPEGKAFEQLFNLHYGEGMFDYLSGVSPTSMKLFFERFAQLSPSDHTAPQGEEELRNRAESYATELVRIVICDEVEEDIASDDEVIEKYKDEWSIAADAYLAGAKGLTDNDLRNNH